MALPGGRKAGFADWHRRPGESAASKGGHGFGPTRRDLHASLVMQGPDVPNTGNLGLVRMTQIGPTIASWFEVSLSPKADSPIAQLVKAAAPR